MVYDWTRQRCGNDFIPDSPARAFRRADQQVALIATHRTNWMMLGSDFDKLTPFCHSILPSWNLDNSEGLFWIQATYSPDGRNVVALLSNDLKKVQIGNGCKPSGEPGRCWLNKIALAESSDMGNNFMLADSKDRFIAQIGSTYPDTATRRIGVFTTSNIVNISDKFYMMAFDQTEGKSSSGNCLYQSTDPLRAHSWRAWDGTGFTVDMSSGNELCKHLQGLPSEVRSVSFSTKNNLWIAIMSARQKLSDDLQPISGFYYSTSKNLIDWSPIKRIIPAPLRPRVDSITEVWSYPSLIDTNSKSRNFDTIDGDKASLFFTVYHLQNGKGTMKRDLRYLPIEIEANDAK